MKIFIIGASGLVGGNCYKYFKEQGFSVVGTHVHNPTENTEYFNASDLNDNGNLNINEYKPDVIIHCAALTNVDYCEEHRDESFTKTVIAAKNVAHLANQLKSKLIYISTDYVFDGNKGPYTEDDATNPINIYGKHKLEAEQLIKELLIDFLILRITNVYGDEIRNKNFISRMIDLIKKNEPVSFKFPIDQFATPINAEDVAKAIFTLLLKKSTGIYHLASTDFYSRSQLFDKIIDFYPSTKNITITLTTTELMQQTAKRPLVGGLIASKFLKENPNFKFSNVDNYLLKIKNKKNEF